MSQLIPPAPAYSHLPLLADLVRQNRVKTVLEFGCGIGSTQLLCNLCQYVHSMEMNHREWLDFVASLGLPRWRGSFHPGPIDAIESLYVGTQRYDMILVDGHGDSRPAQVLAAVNFAPLVVIHDTEEASYGWATLWPFLTEYDVTHHETPPNKTTVVRRLAR